MAKKDYYKGMTIEFEANTTKVSEALEPINKKIGEMNSAARQLDAALKLDPQSIGLVKDRAEVAAKQLENMRERAEVLKRALATAEDPVVIERLTRQSDIAEAKIKSLTEQLERLNAEVAKQGGGLMSSLQGAGETLASIGEAASSVGDRMTVGLTVPATAFATAAVAAATTVDTALTDVRKTVDGTEKEYQALKEAAIEYSKTNGVTAEDVLEVQALAAQLGYAVDELEVMGRVGSGLSIATDMGAEQATTELAQFANITGMAHDQSENYASTIVALGNTMATTESKVSSMAQSIAAAGTQVGMSEADILGIAAALSSMGLEAQGGGSNVSKIMSQIDKDVATSSENVKTWAAAAGMSADEFAAKWRERPVEALQALFAGMSGAVEGGTNLSAILEELGIKSAQATDVAKRLTSGHELLGRAVETANAAWRENTALAEEVANRNDSLEAKMQMLQNRVTAILEKVGKPVADALLAIVDAAEPLFDALESGAKAFADMDEGQQRLVVSAVAAAAALGPMLSVGGRIAETFGGVLTSLGSAGEGIMTFVSSVKELHSAGLLGEAALEGLSGALASAGPAIAVVAAAWLAADLVGQIMDYVGAAKEMEDATSGLHDAMSQLSRGVESTGIADTARSIDEIRSASRELTKEQADLADSMREAMGEAGKSAGMLETYARTIEELTGKGELNRGEQERLQQAVDGFNSIAQTSISVIDGQTGALDTNVKSIREVIAAYKDYAQAQAALDAYSKVQEQIIENQIEMKRLEEELASADKGVSWYIGDFAVFSDFGGVADRYHELEKSMADARERSEELKFAQGELAGMIDGSTTSTETYQAALERLGVAAKQTGDDATDAGNKAEDAANQAAEAMAKASDEAVKAQTRANEQAYREQQRAYQAEAKALQKQMDAEYRERQRAYQREADALSKALDQEYAARQKAYQAEADMLSKQLDQEYQERSKAYEREYSLLSKQLDRDYQQLSKSLSAQLAAIKDANSKAYQSRKSALDAERKAVADAASKAQKELSKTLSKELDARKKANSKLVEEARKANDAEVKAYQAATKQRIAAIDEEYRAKLKLLEADPRSSAIDSRIKELESEGEAEDSAAKERERAEKTAELRREVERAKSRRKRAEAEKALADYLLQIEEERHDEERSAEVAALREEQSLIKEEIAAKKESLKEEYDNRKEVIQTERASELEVIREANSLEVEALRERLTAEEEAMAEANSLRLEQERAASDERVALMAEAHERELESYRAALDAQAEAASEANAARLESQKEHNSETLSNLKESQQAELESIRESNSEQVSALREAQSEQLQALKDAQGEQVQALRDAQSDELQALRDSQSEQVQSVRDAQADALQAMKDSQSDQIAAMKEGGSVLKAEAKSTGSEVSATSQATGKKIESDARNLYSSLSKTLKEMTGVTKSETKSAGDSAKSATSGAASAVEKTLATLKQQAVSHMREQASGIKSANADTERNIKEPYAKGVDGAKTALSNGTGIMSSALKNLLKASTQPLSDLPPAFRRDGESSTSNLASGMTSSAHMVGNAANTLARYQEYANRSRDGHMWGADLDINIGNGMYDYAYHVANASNYIASIIANSLAHSVPKTGPLSEGGRGEALWGEHLVDNIVSGMESRERELALESERLARIVEGGFSPDLSMRYDASLSYGRDAYAGRGGGRGGTTVGRQEINVSVHLDGVSLSSPMDVRSLSRDLARQTAAELAAQLG